MPRHTISSSGHVLTSKLCGRAFIRILQVAQTDIFTNQTVNYTRHCFTSQLLFFNTLFYIFSGLASVGCSILCLSTNVLCRLERHLSSLLSIMKRKPSSFPYVEHSLSR